MRTYLRGARITCAFRAGATVQEVAGSSLLNDWLARHEMAVHAIKVRHADRWFAGGKIKLLNMKVTATDRRGHIATRVVELRGDSVDVLVVLTHEQTGKKFFVFVKQGRIAAGGDVVSNVAGMIDENETPTAAALREASEELKEYGTIEWDEPVDLGKKIANSIHPFDVSPGLIDERVHYILLTATVSQEVLDRLQGKQAGLTKENEQTLVILVPQGGRRFLTAHVRHDLKLTTSLSLYHFSTMPNWWSVS